MKLKLDIKKSDYILMIIVLILIVCYIFIKTFTYKSEPILLEYAKKKSTNIITSIINDSVNKVIYSNNYDEIIKVEKDNNGNIISLDFDNNTINMLLYLVTNDILDNITSLENGNYNNIETKNSVYYIPISIIHNNPILVNIGPKIPFKIEYLGSANNEIKTNVKEYGINSSMIEVLLSINLKVQVILPFKSQTINISKNILLDNKIVQGKIPDYYGGLISSSLK